MCRARGCLGCLTGTREALGSIPSTSKTMWWCVLVIKTLEIKAGGSGIQLTPVCRQRETDLYKFKAILVHAVTSRPPKAI